MGIINRDQLIEKIANAKKCVRVLGAVAFDLPYAKLREGFYEKLNNEKEGEKFFLEIICEADSTLSYDSLISADRTVSGEINRYELGVLRNAAEEALMNLKDFLKKKKSNHLEPIEDVIKAEKEKEKRRANGEDVPPPLEECQKDQRFFIRTYYIPIKVPAIQIDDSFYISYALTKFNCLEKFEEITTDHLWYQEFRKYFGAFITNPNGAKRYSTEQTEKGNKLEVIEMYNEKRVPLGQLPRDSFLGTTKVKTVVWGLIFTRDGKLLLHKRKENAKDNRNMWDKSIGGHVDISKDIDTVQAASRELIEELYYHEKEGQGGHNDNNMFQIDSSYLIFLGEWRPKYRYDKLYEEIEYNQDQNYFFRMSYDYSKIVRESPRYFENGVVKRARVFADLYVCVSSEDFEKKVYEGELENSEYLLLYPEQIKDFYDEKKTILTDEEYDSYVKLFNMLKMHAESKNKQFNLPFELFSEEGFGTTVKGLRLKGDAPEMKLTPDLDNIINSEIWENEISAFSMILRTRYAEKKKESK